MHHPFTLITKAISKSVKTQILYKWEPYETAQLLDIDINVLWFGQNQLHKSFQECSQATLTQKVQPRHWSTRFNKLLATHIHAFSHQSSMGVRIAYNLLPIDSPSLFNSQATMSFPVHKRIRRCEKLPNIASKCSLPTSIFQGDILVFGAVQYMFNKLADYLFVLFR